jgi:flagellar hook-associated protein 3 FlgL
MRITANRLIDLSAAATTKQQARVADLSAEVSSGLRVTTPSDDPTAWLSAQRTKLRAALSQGAGAAVATSRDRLATTDTALASLGDVVSQVRALAVQAASASYDATSRAALGGQVHGLFLAALGNANVQGADGEYLLAGSLAAAAPFTATGAYVGDAGARAVPADGGVTSAVSIPGSQLTAAAGVDVLPLLDKVATAMSANDLPTLLTTLPDLETAVKQVASARSQAGSAVNVLDQATTARDALEQQLHATIARDVEIDGVGAASELAQATQALAVSRAVSSHLLATLAPSA